MTYAVAARTRGWTSVAVALAALGTPLVAGLVLAGDDAADVLLPVALVAVPLTAGLAVAAQRRRSDRLALLAERLRRERDARARLAALEERGRIARELHDSVAHAVSVMVLQAGAAEAVLDERPEQARAALSAVQDVAPRSSARPRGPSRRARAGRRARPAGAGARPGRRARARGAVRRAGLPVHLEVEGDAARAAAGGRAAAYRIVQEALTNALKHSGAATRVVVRHAGGALRARGRQRRRGPPAPSGGGHGLAGMRERAALTAAPSAGSAAAAGSRSRLPAAARGSGA